MIDPGKISALFARTFLPIARLADRNRCAIGSTSDQIATALMDDVPINPRSAFPSRRDKGIHGGCSDRRHTWFLVPGMGGVHNRGAGPDRTSLPSPRLIGDKSPIVWKIEA